MQDTKKIINTLKNSGNFFKGIRGLSSLENHGRIRIIIQKNDIGLSSENLVDFEAKAFKKAIKILKSNIENPDLETAFNILINEGQFEIYAD